MRGSSGSRYRRKVKLPEGVMKLLLALLTKSTEALSDICSGAAKCLMKRSMYLSFVYGNREQREGEREEREMC